MFAFATRHLTRWALALSLIVAVGVLPVLHAQQEPPARHGLPGDQPPEPPPEAFAAWEAQAEGDQVSVTLPDGHVLQAECALFGDRLAARPLHKGPGPTPPAS